MITKYIISLNIDQHKKKVLGVQNGLGNISLWSKKWLDVVEWGSLYVAYRAYTMSSKIEIFDKF